jgi:hypothetical protein
MEGPGMFWSTDGAEAMLKLRGVFLVELWGDFGVFRINREKKKLYANYANTSTVSHEQHQNRKAA